MIYYRFVWLDDIYLIFRKRSLSLNKERERIKRFGMFSKVLYPATIKKKPQNKQNHINYPELVIKLP